MTGATLVARHAASGMDAQHVRWLLEAVAGEPYAALCNQEIDASIEAAVFARIDRVSDGEPLQYVLGSWQFRTLELAVDPRALIPRPETEQVVEAALRAMGRPGRLSPRVVVDLGCGSGAIALSLDAELVRGDAPLVIIATDASSDALDLARTNAANVGARSVTFAHGNWFDALSDDLRGRVDLVISNPPYIGRSEAPTLDPALRYEPEAALFAGDSDRGLGTADLICIIDEALVWLAQDGVLVLECDPRQVDALSARAAHLGSVTPIIDLAGRPRGIVVDTIRARS